MRHLVIVFFVLFMLCTPVPAADSLESLQKQLQALEAELPEILKEETDLDTQHDYVKRVLALREKIEALEGVEGDKTDDNRTVLILKSVRLKSRPKGGSDYEEDENYNTDGFASEGRDGNWVRTLKVQEYPAKIVLGEPFIFKVLAAQRGQSRIMMGLKRGYNPAPGIVAGRIDIQAAAQAKGQPVEVTTDFTFENTLSAKSGMTYGIYGIESSANGQFENGNSFDHYPSAKKVDLVETVGYGIRPSGKGPGFTVSFLIPIDPSLGSSNRAQRRAKEEEKELEFLYRHSKTDAEPAKVTAFALPDLSDIQDVAQNDGTISDSDETAGKDGDQAGSKSESDGKNSGEDGSPVQRSGQEITAQQVVQEKDARRPHIEYWLANAQPVENAQPGYRLTYDKWGRVQGKASNGTITLAKPDSGALSPAEYAWTLADTIDSLNLCTLREYVDRKLANRETASCQKDIPQQQLDSNSLPNFVAMEAAKAKADLQKLGVTVKWRAGSIAKDAAQQSTIEKQQPAPGADLKNIKKVELWVYRYAASNVLVPDVVGMKFKDAAARLKREGLVPGIGMIYKPQARNEAGKVVSQQTSAGKKVASGATVLLDIASGGSAQVSMPYVIGLPYVEAAKKVKAVGLKPLKKLGPYASRPDQPGTVKDAGIAAGRKLNIGAAITMTVYNTYSEKTRPKEPEEIVKRDPASAFGGKAPPESPAATNMDWAGMWHVIGRYDMELHVSGNRVTGRYGKNMDNTIEGTISGNILKGWWREEKSRGRFENKIRDNGNFWKGVWNMKDKPGGWNGGWSAKRIGEKKQPEKIVKRDPASAFGGKKDPAPASSPSGSGGKFNCNTGIPRVILETSGPLYSNRKNGVPQEDGAEAKNYICRYKTRGGKRHVALITFFDKQPTTSEGKKWKDYMCGFRMKYRKNLPFYINQQGEVGLSELVGRENVMRFHKFHIDQFAPYAISCSGNSRPGGSANTGTTTNHSGRMIPGGTSSGASCMWDGGHDMLGIPGVEVRVYCKCNGQIVSDNRCSGPKPKGNHYNRR